MIERKPGGEPLYSQISDLIKADLEKLRYGDRVPSEAELMEKYKVSRGTVIQAISSLVNAGFLYRIQGKGTFRGNGPINDMHVQNLLPSFSNTLLMAGKVPAISGKKLSSVPADSEISAALSVAVGDEVWKMERLRGEMGRDPICYATAYIPKSIIPDLKEEDLELSILDMLILHFHFNITSTFNSVYVSRLGEEAANVSGLSADRIVLCSEFTARIKDGRPCMFDKAKNWGSDFKYFFESRISYDR